MNHAVLDWINHPGRNPKMPSTEIGQRSRRHPERSRWIPHQGKRERARHAAKLAARV